MEIQKKISLRPTDEREEKIIKEVKELKNLGCSINIDEESKTINIICPAEVKKEAFLKMQEI